MKDKRGLLTFELDLLTREVKEAQWKPGSIFCSYSAMDGGSTMETWLLVKRENCHYFMALNIKNAIRKANIYNSQNNGK